LGNNQGNFQLHRFTRRENTAKSFREGYFFDSRCTLANEVSALASSFSARSFGVL